MNLPEDPDPNDTTDPRNLRRPWTEGPDEDAPEESWLSDGDDVLLHRIETVGPEDEVDERLIDVVQSDRHFFIRQEAAKKVRDRSLLFPFEDDRHIGQILVRYLTRREDVTYLERLVARSQHAEVRAAAQVQLAQLWGRLGGPSANVPEGEEPPPPPEFSKPDEEPPSARPAPAGAEAPGPPEVEAATVEPAAAPEPVAAVEPAGEPESRATAVAQVTPSQAAAKLEALAAQAVEAVEALERDAAPETPEPSPEAEPPKEQAAEVETAPTAPAAEDDGVDGSLLGWAIHFLVEQVWSHLDTRAARGLLLRTHAELLPFHPALAFFSVEDDAHVQVDLTGGTRVPRESVAGVAVWMMAFLEATRSSVPDLDEVDVRESTRLMADALEQVGFYEAVREVEEKA